MAAAHRFGGIGAQAYVGFNEPHESETHRLGRGLPLLRFMGDRTIRPPEAFVNTLLQHLFNSRPNPFSDLYFGVVAALQIGRRTG